MDEDDEWTRDELRYLISTFQKNPELYDSKHPYYSNKNQRIIAYNKIRADLQPIKKVSAQCIRMKLKSLRGKMGIERKRERKASRWEEDYVPTLWFYNDMKFIFGQNENNSSSLDPQESPICSQQSTANNLQEEDVEFMTENEFEQGSPTPESADNCSENSTVSLEEVNLNGSVERKKQHRVSLEAFCEYLFMELREIKCEEMMDKGKMQILELVTKLKEEDRKLYAQQQLEANVRNGLTSPYLPKSGASKTGAPLLYIQRIVPAEYIQQCAKSGVSAGKSPTTV